MPIHWLKPLRERLEMHLERLGLRRRLVPCYVRPPRSDRRIAEPSRQPSAFHRHQFRARQRLG